MSALTLRRVVAAAALVSASVAAHAASTVSLNFDSVASGTSANDYLDSKGITGIRFADAITVDDEPQYDTIGNLLNDGAFHWAAGSNTVLVKNDGTAISGTNVLWNDHAPILLQFTPANTVLSFSIQQDSTGYGNPMGGILSFLDASGHVINGADVAFQQFGNPGGLITSTFTVSHASAVLLPALRSYDNLSITTTAPVPEPSTLALAAVGLCLAAALGRRRA